MNDSHREARTPDTGREALPGRLKRVALMGTAVAFCAIAGWAGCGEEAQQAPEPPTPRVDILSDTAHVIVGGSVQLTATVMGLPADQVLATELSWLSRDTAVATVDPTGLVLGFRLGLTWIVASLDESVDSTVVRVVSHHVLTHGPMVGAVTPTSAKIWVRAVPEAVVAIRYWPSADSAQARTSTPTRTSADRDYTAIVTLSALRADTRYTYRPILEQEDAGPVFKAEFRTFPQAADYATIGILADLGERRPAPAISALSADEPDVVLVIGDWPHRDAVHLEEWRHMYRDTREDRLDAGKRFRDEILARTPVARVWDDHDYATNDSDKTFERKDQAIRAHDEYWPGYDRPNPTVGIWHSFTYGELVEIVMLDLRSQRDPNPNKDPRFKLNDPSSIKEILNDPERSMLDGDAEPQGRATGQKEWLKQRLLVSNAPWKLIVSSVAWNLTNNKLDTWSGFRAEWRELYAFIESRNITGVIIVSGDFHTGGAIDDGTNSGVPEMSVPGTNTVSATCNVEAGGCGTWSETLRPTGNGYGLVVLTPGSASIQTRDEDGHLLSELRIPRP